MKRRRIDPSYFNWFVILAVILHLVVPIRTIIRPPLTYFGWVFIVAAVTLNARAVAHLRMKLTPVKFGRSPRILVTDGPYRFSRNPIYLSGVVLLLGVAVVLGSLVAWVFPVLLFLLLDRIYIPDEETLMEEEFGHMYLQYKRAVRRWL